MDAERLRSERVYKRELNRQADIDRHTRTGISERDAAMLAEADQTAREAQERANEEAGRAPRPRVSRQERRHIVENKEAEGRVRDEQRAVEQAQSQSPSEARAMRRAEAHIRAGVPSNEAFVLGEAEEANHVRQQQTQRMMAEEGARKAD